MLGAVILQYWRDSDGFHGRLKEHPQVQATDPAMLKMIVLIRETYTAVTGEPSGFLDLEKRNWSL